MAPASSAFILKEGPPIPKFFSPEKSSCDAFQFITTIGCNQVLRERSKREETINMRDLELASTTDASRSKLSAKQKYLTKLWAPDNQRGKLDEAVKLHLKNPDRF